MQKKEYNPQLGKSVEAMAAAGITQKKIGELLPEVVTTDIDRKGGLYRKDWERGLSLASGSIIKSYLQMAASGKCWSATKHWLATKGGVVEPKEIIVDSVKPDLSHLTTEQLAQIVNIADSAKPKQE